MLIFSRLKAEILKNAYFYLNATHNQAYYQLQEPQLYVEGLLYVYVKAVI